MSTDRSGTAALSERTTGVAKSTSPIRRVQTINALRISRFISQSVLHHQDDG
jgi:hypothetical protein